MTLSLTVPAPAMPGGASGNPFVEQQGPVEPKAFEPKPDHEKIVRYRVLNGEVHVRREHHVDALRQIIDGRSYDVDLLRMQGFVLEEIQ
jgi:hypothetical protein